MTDRNHSRTPQRNRPFGIDIQLTSKDWRDIELCCMHNGAHRAKVIRLTGTCLPGVN